MLIFELHTMLSTCRKGCNPSVEASQIAGRALPEMMLRFLRPSSQNSCQERDVGDRMPRAFQVISLTFVGLSLAATAWGQNAAPRPNFRPGSVIIQRVPIIPPSHTPLAQIPMDQIPSTPPQVTYANGLLTIVAENSNLGDILREVHKQTGAKIDVPPSANERVAARFGPGAPRDVLASLLNGSAFNYVLAGSETNPTGVSSVVLIPKSNAGSTPAMAYQPTPQYSQPQMTQQMMAPGAGPGGPVVQQQGANEEDAEEDADAEDASDDAENDQPAAAPAQGAQSPGGQPQPPKPFMNLNRTRPADPSGANGTQTVTPEPDQQSDPNSDNN